MGTSLASLTSSASSSTSSRERAASSAGRASRRSRASFVWRSALASALALVASSGCTDGDDDPPGTAHPTNITLGTERQPLLLAYREVGRSWQTLPNEAWGSYEIEVLDAYEVVVVCPGTGQERVRASRHGRVPSDGVELGGLCAAPPPLRVEGEVAQPGAVSLGGFAAFSTTADWPLSFAVGAGTYDLVFSTLTDELYDRIGVRRGIAVADHLDLGRLDLSQEPSYPTVPVTFTASNVLAGEQRSAQQQLTIGGRLHVMHSGTARAEPWRVPLAPPEVLAPGDLQAVALTATTLATPSSAPALSRTRYVDGALTDREIDLPENLDGVVFQGDPREPSAVLPGGLYSHTRFHFERNSWDFATPTGTAYDLTISLGFVAATRAARLELRFRDVPGFLESWYDSGPGGFLHRLTLSAFSGKPGVPGSSVSTVHDTMFMGPTAR